jgi:dynein heavy chain
MIVGPTGGGKTTVLQALAKAQTRLERPTKLYILNPKAQTVVELYGTLDAATREWTDGLLSNIFRELNRPLPAGKENELRYIVFDGDVDAVWVENMNSVMDDNKLLTLPNSERIRLQPHCSLLFEVGDLQYASPATVSRCGMVYVDPKDLQHEPYLWRWLKSLEGERPAEHLEHVRELLTKYVPRMLAFVCDGLHNGEFGARPKSIIPQTELQMVQQLCNLLAHVLAGAPNLQEFSELEALFLFCATWSFGGALQDTARSKFDVVLKEISQLPTIESDAVPVGCSQLPGAQPTLFDYKFSPEDARWLPWSLLAPEYVPVPDGPFYSIMIPTGDTMRNTWLLSACLKTRRPVILCGQSGSAKSVIITKLLEGLNSETMYSLTMNFSSRTTAADVQRIVEDNIEKRSKNTYARRTRLRGHCSSACLIESVLSDHSSLLLQLFVLPSLSAWARVIGTGTGQ